MPVDTVPQAQQRAELVDLGIATGGLLVEFLIGADGRLGVQGLGKGGVFGAAGFWLTGTGGDEGVRGVLEEGGTPGDVEEVGVVEVGGWHA